MPVGSSGRIVIEIDPELKQELYQYLYQQDLKLKDWFLANVKELLIEKNQLDLCFDDTPAPLKNGTFQDVGRKT